MDTFLSGFYFFCNTSSYYWTSYGAQQCLVWGFSTLLICTLLMTLFYYFVYTKSGNAFKKSTRLSWLLVGLVGMLITFIVSEIVVGACSGVGAIGDNGPDILLFCLLGNGVWGFIIFYLLFSTIFQNFSSYAKNTPWPFHTK